MDYNPRELGHKPRALDHNPKELACKPRALDHKPEARSPFPGNSNGKLSPEALSLVRVVALLDSFHIHTYILESLREMFTARPDLMIDFPTTAAAHTQACAELFKSGLIEMSDQEKAFSMRPNVQTSVLVDMYTSGLMSTLFNATVAALTMLWPWMVCVPDRTIDPEEFAMATAPGTTYEAFLRNRHHVNKTPHSEEFALYATHNIWGRRDELVFHILSLERVFCHLCGDTLEECATLTFAQLLAEASWYYFERSRYDDAQIKIQAALGVHEMTRWKSSLHYASIYRIYAAIAMECRKEGDAAMYAGWQLQQLDLQWTGQGDMLRRSGLLDKAPDAVAVSPWVFDIPPGDFVMLPFRSVSNFGWKFYLLADDERDPMYTRYLYQADACFRAIYQDCRIAHTRTQQMRSRTGEFLYALGNVAVKLGNVLGEPLYKKSLQFFEDALLVFKMSMPDQYNEAGMAKTQYKLAVHFTRSKYYQRALYHCDKAFRYYATSPPHMPHFARLTFLQSVIQTLTNDKRWRSTAHRAFVIRGMTALNGERTPEEMSLADYDEQVWVWDR